MADSYFYFSELNNENLFLDATDRSIQDYTEKDWPQLTPSLADQISQTIPQNALNSSSFGQSSQFESENSQPLAKSKRIQKREKAKQRQQDLIYKREFQGNLNEILNDKETVMQNLKELLSQTTDKKIRQKIQNRMSAQISRDKKKAYVQNLEDQIERLQIQVKTLSEHNQELSKKYQTLLEKCTYQSHYHRKSYDYNILEAEVDKPDLEENSKQMHNNQQGVNNFGRMFLMGFGIMTIICYCGFSLFNSNLMMTSLNQLSTSQLNILNEMPFNYTQSLGETEQQKNRLALSKNKLNQMCSKNDTEQYLIKEQEAKNAKQQVCTQPPQNETQNNEFLGKTKKNTNNTTNSNLPTNYKENQLFYNSQFKFENSESKQSSQQYQIHQANLLYFNIPKDYFYQFLINEQKMVIRSFELENIYSQQSFDNSSNQLLEVTCQIQSIKEI